MFIIVPKLITPESGLQISTTVPENDCPAWNSGTNYTINQQAMDGHNIYQALTNNVGKQPSLNTDTDIPDWILFSATNAWKMHDKFINTQTVQAGGIEIQLNGSRCDSLAMFNNLGSQVQIRAVVGGQTVLDKSVNLWKQNAASWTDYFLGEIVMGYDFTVPIALYAGAVTYKISMTGESCACGRLVMGRKKTLGRALWPSSLGIDDFSQKKIDSFGNVYLSPGACAKKGDITINVPRVNTDYVYEFLESIRGTAVVFVGDNRDIYPEDRPLSCVLVLGYYGDFQVVDKGPVMNTCTIQIKGLI